MAYVNILADVLSSVAGSVIPPGAEPSRNALMAGITFFGALPIAILVHSPQVTYDVHGTRGLHLSRVTACVPALCTTVMIRHLTGVCEQRRPKQCILSKYRIYRWLPVWAKSL